MRRFLSGHFALWGSVFAALYPIPAPAAVPLNDAVGDNDLGGHQIGVLHVADHLCCGLCSQLEGIDIHGGELGGGQTGEEGVVEGENGDISRYGKPHFHAHPLYCHRQDIVADQDGAGRLSPPKKPFQGQAPLPRILRKLQAQLVPVGDMIVRQRKPIPRPPVSSKYQRMAAGNIADAPVPQID